MSSRSRSTSRPRLGITGANGFIGQALTRAALSAGYQVTALILPGTPDPALSKAGAQVVPLELTDNQPLRQVFDNIDILVNLAGTMQGASRQRYRSANVETVRGIVAAASACPRPPRLIQMSSVAALGPSLDAIPLSEEALPRPVSPYGETKQLGETLALELQGTLVLRPPSIYGPGDRCFFDLFQWARRGVFPLLCTRTKRFNLLYRDDLLGLLLRVIERPDLTGILHLGFPLVHTATDLADALGAAAKRTLRPFFLPRGVVRLFARLSGVPERLGFEPALMSPGKAEEMSNPCWLQDFSRARRLLEINEQASSTSLSQGISTTMNWYRENRWL